MMTLAGDEIGINDALALVNGGKSIFVWMGGPTPTPLYQLLGIESSKVLSVEPYELVDKETYPKALERFERPIFVCHHGISSCDVVEHIRSFGKSGYSLGGGLEGLKRRSKTRN